MAAVRTLAPLLALSLISLPARAAAEEDEDWRVFAGALTLLQQVVHVAATSSDPEAARKRVDSMIEGKDPEANRIAARMMGQMLEDVPAEHRESFATLARDLLVLARRDQAAASSRPAAAAPEAAVQARRQLHAMGLRYWDEQQFLEAVRRGDRIAVDLYLAAGGLESRNSGSSRNPPPAR